MVILLPKRLVYGLIGVPSLRMLVWPMISNAVTTTNVNIVISLTTHSFHVFIDSFAKIIMGKIHIEPMGGIHGSI